MDTETLERILEEKRELVSKEIQRMPINSKVPNLLEGIEYSLKGGSKFLRSTICLETCRRLGGDEKKALPLAIASQLLHNWLIIHDDILDGDVIRYNQETIWSKFGLSHGVNIGDYLAHKTFGMVLELEDIGLSNDKVLGLVKLLIEVVCKTLEGQAMDINLRTKDDFTEDEYIKMVTKKTAYYLSFPLIGGAIITNANRKVLEELMLYSKKLGPAFQIRDDLIDLTDSKGRGEIGCDIKEGKRTLLIAFTIKKCTDDEKRKLFGILNKPRAVKTEEEVNYVIDLFKKYGAIDYAQQKAEEFVEEVKSDIKDLPEELKDFLYTFADYVISRET